MCDLLFLAAVVADSETGMTAAYPAANTYTSPAFANSPRAASTIAPRGWFARKPTTAAAPLTAASANAEATSTDINNSFRFAQPTVQPTVGPLENASQTRTQTAPYGAITQHNGYQRSNSNLSQEQPTYAVAEAASEAARAKNVVYAKESEMGPVGPSGSMGVFGPSRSNTMNGPLHNDNKAGFFQSS